MRERQGTPAITRTGAVIDTHGQSGAEIDSAARSAAGSLARGCSRRRGRLGPASDQVSSKARQSSAAAGPAKRSAVSRQGGSPPSVWSKSPAQASPMHRPPTWPMTPSMHSDLRWLRRRLAIGAVKANGWQARTLIPARFIPVHSSLLVDSEPNQSYST